MLAEGRLRSRRVSGSRAAGPVRSYAARVPELQPPELARLVDHAERPRAGDWSLRGALVRYAQFRPGHVRDLMDLVRRLDHALHTQAKVLAGDGEALWRALDGEPDQLPADARFALELLRVAQDLDGVADEVVAWAEDRAGDLPDAQVEAAVARIGRRLEELGVGPEERARPPRRT